MKSLFTKLVIVLASATMIAGCGGKDKIKTDEQTQEQKTFLQTVSTEHCYIGTVAYKSEERVKADSDALAKEIADRMTLSLQAPKAESEAPVGSETEDSDVIVLFGTEKDEASNVVAYTIDFNEASLDTENDKGRLTLGEERIRFRLDSSAPELSNPEMLSIVAANAPEKEAGSHTVVWLGSDISVDDSYLLEIKPSQFEGSMIGTIKFISKEGEVESTSIAHVIFTKQEDTTLCNPESVHLWHQKNDELTTLQNKYVNYPERAGLEADISALDETLKRLDATLSDPNFVQEDRDAATTAKENLSSSATFLNSRALAEYDSMATLEKERDAIELRRVPKAEVEPVVEPAPAEQTETSGEETK